MSKLPLYVLTGSSATGKTTVIKELRRLMPNYEVFDHVEIKPFIREESSNKVDRKRLNNIWLRVARNIAESARITILCGRILPVELEKCEDFSYFSQVNFLILHCDDETREKRLRSRKKMTDKKIEENKALAKWFLENADKYTPAMPIFDTSKTDITKVAEQIMKWINGEQDRGKQIGKLE